MERYFLLFIGIFPLLAHSQLSDDVAGHYKDYIQFCEQHATADMTRDAYKMFKKVLNAATEQELLYIEHAGNSTTKEYIVKELVDRKSAALFGLFEQYLQSEKTELISTGADEYEWNLAIEMYQSVVYQKEKLERRNYYEQTTSQNLLTDVKQLFGPEYDTRWTIGEVDSLLAQFDAAAMANANVSVDLLNSIFKYRNYKMGNAERVRFFAAKYPTPEILATLASFKNLRDVPFLQQHMNKAFLAVARFPHPTFLPELRKRIDIEFQNKDFQAAVSSFCNAEARVILETIYTKIASNRDRNERDEKLFTLYGIMERQNYAFYRSTLSKIDALLN